MEEILDEILSILYCTTDESNINMMRRRKDEGMTTLAHITVSEFESLVQTANLPLNTRLTVTIEDDRAALEFVKRQKALAAMQKLRGSGTGHLVEKLLQERQKDTQL